MRSDRRDSSFDLGLARQLAARLAVGAAPEASRPAQAYVRFRPAGAASAGPRGPDDEVFGPASWHRLLDRCMVAAAASASFAMGASGLLVATRGRVPGDIEHLGARLMAIMDQSVRLESLEPPCCLSVQLGRSWLTGLRVALPTSESITLGLFGPRPPDRERTQQIAQMLSERETG